MTNYLYKCGKCSVVYSYNCQVGKCVTINCVVCRDNTIHYLLEIVNPHKVGGLHIRCAEEDES